MLKKAGCRRNSHFWDCLSFVTDLAYSFHSSPRRGVAKLGSSSGFESLMISSPWLLVWCSRTLIYFMIQAESSQSESQNHYSSNNVFSNSRLFLTHALPPCAAPLTPPQFFRVSPASEYLLALLLVNENRKLDCFTNDLISSLFQLCLFSSGC